MKILFALAVLAIVILPIVLLFARLDRSVPSYADDLRGRLRYGWAYRTELGRVSLASDELIERAAALLSIETDEVHDVVEADDDGEVLLIKTTDGASYIVVPEDDPDDDGKYGVMFLVEPHPNYAGDFPVYRKSSAKAEIDRIAAVRHFAELDDAEDQAAADLGAERELDEPPSKPAGATAAEQEATAAALVTESGKSAEPVPAPGPEHAEDVVERAAGALDAVEEATDKAEKAGDPVPAKKAAKARAAAKRPRRN